MKKTILRGVIAMALLYGTINKTFVQSTGIFHAAGFMKTSVQQFNFHSSNNTVMTEEALDDNLMLARAHVYRLMY